MGWCQSMTLILWLRELVMNSKSTSALLEHQPLKENKRRSDKANLMTKSPPKVQGTWANASTWSTEMYAVWGTTGVPSISHLD